MTYNISWSRKDWGKYHLIVEMTEDEKNKIQTSLEVLRKYIDFPKPKIGIVMSTLPGCSYEEARQTLATVIGCSQLPE